MMIAQDLRVQGGTHKYLQLRAKQLHFSYKKPYLRDFPGGTVVKNPPANAGDTGSSPGPGRSHMPWSN